jgi:hypothetical protein
VVLGDCLSEPSGLSQPFTYEPLERLLADPLGKGDGDTLTDCYALGMVVMHTLLGADHYRNIKQEPYIESLLHLGSYNTNFNMISENDTFSDVMQDFLRGVLNDSRQDRWTTGSIEAWLDGKRFNLIHPFPPRDSSRAYMINGKEHFNKRSIAHFVYNHWGSCASLFKGNKFLRWVEQASSKTTTLKDKQLYIVEDICDDATDLGQLKDDQIARTIVCLDPQGPIRLKNISSNIDGMGTLLNNFLTKKNQHGMNLVSSIIEFDLPSIKIDMNEDEAPSAIVAGIVWKLKKIRLLMRSEAVGFGIERALYDLNQDLPCQSPLVSQYQPTTLEDLILVLNEIAPVMYDKSTPLDRHIAAFVTSKMEFDREVKVTEIDLLPKLSRSPELVALKVLMRVQRRLKNPKLPGLTAWLVLRLLPDVGESINHQDSLKLVQRKLYKAARTGMLNEIADILFDKDLAELNYHGFRQAKGQYIKNMQTIDFMSNEEEQRKRADAFGGRLATIIAFTTFIVTAYSVISEYLGL